MLHPGVSGICQRWQIPAGARACAIGLLLLTIGCAPRYVQLAQDSFSKGAAIENRAIVPGSDNTGALPTSGSALVAYTDARDNIRKAFGKQRSELDSDGLTGSAFALQALISWRLDDLLGSTDATGDVCSGQNYRDCAKASSQQAVLLMKNQPGLTRDSFTMTILPGLLDHNLGLKVTQQTPKDASDHFMSAFVVIGRGVEQLGPMNTPIRGPATQVQQLQAYGMMAQFQTLRAWYAALDRASTPGFSNSQQALTGDQRLACWEALIFGRGTDVTNKLRTLDPDHLYISVSMLNSMTSSLGIGDHNPVPGTCPWQS